MLNVSKQTERLKLLKFESICQQLILNGFQTTNSLSYQQLFKKKSGERKSERTKYSFFKIVIFVN